MVGISLLSNREGSEPMTLPVTMTPVDLGGRCAVTWRAGSCVTTAHDPVSFFYASRLLKAS